MKPEDAQRIAVRMVRTPHPCSRYCCGNPRHYFGTPTNQELRAGDPWDGWEDDEIFQA